MTGGGENCPLSTPPGWQEVIPLKSSHRKPGTMVLLMTSLLYPLAHLFHLQTYCLYLYIPSPQSFHFFIHSCNKCFLDMLFVPGAVLLMENSAGRHSVSVLRELSDNWGSHTLNNDTSTYMLTKLESVLCPSTLHPSVCIS